MPRRHRCPVPNCPKRGSPSALAHHRRDKHPQIDPIAYQNLLMGRKTKLLPKRRPGWRVFLILALCAVAGALAYIIIDRLS